MTRSLRKLLKRVTLYWLLLQQEDGRSVLRSRPGFVPLKESPPARVVFFAAALSVALHVRAEALSKANRGGTRRTDLRAKISHLIKTTMEQLTGRLTADAKVSTVKGDKKVVNFTIAINDSYPLERGNSTGDHLFLKLALKTCPIFHFLLRRNMACLLFNWFRQLR
jgi:hypothetical protein